MKGGDAVVVSDSKLIETSAIRWRSAEDDFDEAHGPGRVTSPIYADDSAIMGERIIAQSYLAVDLAHGSRWRGCRKSVGNKVIGPFLTLLRNRGFPGTSY